MLLPFDYNLLILVIEHAYMVCPGTFIVLFWKLKGTSVYWPWSKGIHSSKAKSPNWQWLPTTKTNFFGFVGSLGTKTIDFWFARAIPWPTTRPIAYVTLKFVLFWKKRSLVAHLKVSSCFQVFQTNLARNSLSMKVITNYLENAFDFFLNDCILGRVVGNGIARANQNSISHVLKTLLNILWPISKVSNHPQVHPKKLDFFLFSG